MAVRFVHALVVCLGILFGYPDEFGLAWVGLYLLGGHMVLCDL